jgi:hypothetical protein
MHDVSIRRKIARNRTTAHERSTNKLNSHRGLPKRFIMRPTMHTYLVLRLECTFLSSSTKVPIAGGTASVHKGRNRLRQYLDLKPFGVGVQSLLRVRPSNTSLRQ